MTTEKQTPSRVIGLDAHPDLCTAAILTGPTPAAALTEKIFDKVPLGQLSRWAQKQTTEQDVIVLEASGNSFQIVRELSALKRRALVLESCQMGKLKEAHANNDKISAVRIGKAYLAGTAKEVWVPDEKTQERRDWFHAHRKTVKRTTQIRNRIRSYLSDHGVRLPANLPLASQASTTEQLRAARAWTSQEWQVLDILLDELRHADQQRDKWRQLIAQEVAADERLLALVRLCGVRELVAFALGAIIGTIDRFSKPNKLVKYVGLNPAFDDSGQGTWRGGIGGHGRKDLRCLLIEAAQALLRSSQALGKWGRKLQARKGSRHLAVAAVARKLTVAIWYLLKGRWTPVEEIDERLSAKVGKIITHLGKEHLQASGKSRSQIREALYETLKSTRIYVLDPNKKMPSPEKPEKAINEKNEKKRQKI